MKTVITIAMDSAKYDEFMQLVGECDIPLEFLDESEEEEEEESDQQ